MFNDVKIEWPDDTPSEATKSKRIRSVFTFPALGSVSPNKVQAMEVQFADGTDLDAHPSLGGRYSDASVREKKHALGSLKVKDPYDFIRATYPTLLGAAKRALLEDTGQSFDAHGSGRFSALWPYFKNAVKQGAEHYKPEARMRISRDVANIKTDDAIQLLPDAMLKVRALRDQINTDPSVLTERVQRSAVRFWVAMFKADAACFKAEAVATPFTAKQARAYIKEAQKRCKAAQEDQRLPVRFMPQVQYGINPLQVAVIHAEALITCEPKSYDRNANGSRVVSRVVYGYGFLAPREKGGIYCSQRSHNEVVTWLCRHADYNATMHAFNAMVEKEQSSEQQE